MRSYRLEIFEPKVGHIDPQRRQTHMIAACDDEAAKVEAHRIYDHLARSGVPVTNFALWDDASTLVRETVRKNAH
jgi:hypothetical protein